MIILNGKKVPTELFPCQETKVKDHFEEWLNDADNVLELKYETDADLILLMFAKCRIDELGYPVTLFMWYMPYGRMDRKFEDDLFTLKYVCKFINTLAFEKVVVMEPHSEKTMELLNNGETLLSHLPKDRVFENRAQDIFIIEEWLPQVMLEIGFSDEKDIIVFPDKGAAKRYSYLPYKNVCIFKKTRDPITRDITEMVLIEGTVTLGAKCIIVDDISTKATTALKAAAVLKNLGASMVILMVAHAEKEVFKGNLLSRTSPIERVYTSTSLMREKHEKIHYLKVSPRKHATSS